MNQEAKTARRSIWADGGPPRDRPDRGGVGAVCFSLSAGIFCVGAGARRSRWHLARHYGGGAGGVKCVW